MAPWPTPASSSPATTPPSARGQLTFSGGTLQGNGTALTPINTKNNINFSSTISGTSDITFNAPWQQAGGTANTLTVNNSGNTILNGTFDLTAANSTRPLTIAGSGNVTMNGVISESSVGANAVGALTKSDNGTLTLTGANTYNGPTT